MLAETTARLLAEITILDLFMASLGFLSVLGCESKHPEEIGLFYLAYHPKSHSNPCAVAINLPDS